MRNAITFKGALVVLALQTSSVLGCSGADEGNTGDTAASATRGGASGDLSEYVGMQAVIAQGNAAKDIFDALGARPDGDGNKFVGFTDEQMGFSGTFDIGLKCLGGPSESQICSLNALLYRSDDIDSSIIKNGDPLRIRGKLATAIFNSLPEPDGAGNTTRKVGDVSCEAGSETVCTVIYRVSDNPADSWWLYKEPLAEFIQHNGPIPKGNAKKMVEFLF